jgi:hypothetical protein
MILRTSHHLPCHLSKQLTLKKATGKFQYYQSYPSLEPSTLLKAKAKSALLNLSFATDEKLHKLYWNNITADELDEMLDNVSNSLTPHEREQFSHWMGHPEMGHMKFRDIGLPTQTILPYLNHRLAHPSPLIQSSKATAPPRYHVRRNSRPYKNPIYEYTDVPSPRQIHHALAVTTPH